MSSNTGVLGSLKQAFNVGGHHKKQQPTTVSTPPAIADDASPMSAGDRLVEVRSSLVAPALLLGQLWVGYSSPRCSIRG